MHPLVGRAEPHPIRFKSPMVVDSSNHISTARRDDSTARYIAVPAHALALVVLKVSRISGAFWATTELAPNTMQVRFSISKTSHLERQGMFQLAGTIVPSFYRSEGFNDHGACIGR